MESASFDFVAVFIFYKVTMAVAIQQLKKLACVVMESPYFMLALSLVTDTHHLISDSVQRGGVDQAFRWMLNVNSQ